MQFALQIAKKESTAFFSSFVAAVFLGTFLVATLFFLFWQLEFFARNIADVRPLFEWMPLILIFLVSAVTMRMWSEERRAGTIEFLMTLPVSTLQLVLGKFLACLFLVSLSLLLTLPVPIVISYLGNLDWGPVVGGYVASIFLAAAYISIGLFVSAKNDNQIVSLIGSVLACLVLYLIGNPTFTTLVGATLGEVLELFGSGSRFESITRGVIDLRDIFYYLSIVGVFLSLNVFSLERLRWKEGAESVRSKRWGAVTTLAVLNFVVANFWLHSFSAGRLDLTENQIYSISPATKTYLSQLQEPLLIRGYFSEKTHPLLAPLMPQVRDLIREYETVGGDLVRAEFVDPREDPELEEEANRKYGITPVPFQISDRHDVSVVNSYFDIVIQYGDKYEVLTFQDLIEVKFQDETSLDVKLRNPEYDITRSIKKVLYGFQSIDNLFASLSEPVTFVGYISDESQLPEQLRTYRAELLQQVEELQTQSGGKLEIEVQDPGSPQSALAQEIEEKYGFRPMATNLFASDTFYFYTLLRSGDDSVLVPIAEGLSAEAAGRAVEAALKRFSSGFLKTVGLAVPPSSSPPGMPPQFQQPGGKQFNLLKDKLSEDYSVTDVDLSTGMVPEDVDLLMLAAPKGLSERERFAVDQFLMKGGTITLLSSPYAVERTETSLSASEYDSGLTDWLDSFGITIEDTLLLDPQNESYPIPVQKRIGAFTVQEIQLVPYPFFPDIRGDQMNQDILITKGIPQVTVNWASPIEFEKKEDLSITQTELLRTSSESWRSETTDVVPNFNAYPGIGFAPRPESPGVTAAVFEGEFPSFFEGKESPLLKQEAEEQPEEGEAEEEEELVISGVIDKSPESARIVLISSNEFASDETLQISAATGSSRFLNSIQLIQNAVDWSLEDRGLLSIRSRGHFSRTLVPLSKDEAVRWELLTYFLVLGGLLLVFLIQRGMRAATLASYDRLLKTA